MEIAYAALFESINELEKYPSFPTFCLNINVSYGAKVIFFCKCQNILICLYIAYHYKQQVFDDHLSMPIHHAICLYSKMQQMFQDLLVVQHPNIEIVNMLMNLYYHHHPNTSLINLDYLFLNQYNNNDHYYTLYLVLRQLFLFDILTTEYLLNSFFNFNIFNINI